MFLRLPLGSARRFAALLLLLGVMLGGAVDAIACEPASEITAINAADAEPLGQKQLPDDERHGDCVHGAIVEAEHLLGYRVTRRIETEEARSVQPS